MRKAPKHLKQAGKGFYLQIQREYVLESGQDWQRLEMACECLDVIAAAREEIEKSGEYYTDRWGAPKAHPGFSLIKDQKGLFVRLIREMALDLEGPPEAARPPAKY